METPATIGNYGSPQLDFILAALELNESIIRLEMLADDGARYGDVSHAELARISSEIKALAEPIWKQASHAIANIPDFVVEEVANG